MYNGVGLPTARGSGTSGRVQSNKFLLRPRPSPSSPAAPSSVPGGARGGIREEMAEHERKRALESRMLELREALEERGYTEAEADARVAEARKAAEEEAEQSAAKEGRGGVGSWPKGTPLGFSLPTLRPPCAVAEPSAVESLKKPAVISRWEILVVILSALCYLYVRLHWHQ